MFRRMAFAFLVPALYLCALAEETSRFSPEQRFGMKWGTSVSMPIRKPVTLNDYLMLTESKARTFVVVEAVECGSDAALKGLRVGDVLVVMNGTLIDSMVQKVVALDELETLPQIASLIVERYGYTYQFFYDLKAGSGSGDFTCGQAE